MGVELETTEHFGKAGIGKRSKLRKGEGTDRRQRQLEARAGHREKKGAGRRQGQATERKRQLEGDKGRQRTIEFRT